MAFIKNLRSDPIRGMFATVQFIQLPPAISKNAKIKIYKDVILHLDLCGRLSHELRTPENGIRRDTFGHKKEEVTGGWGKFHNEELRNLHSSPNIIRTIKLRRVGRLDM
jgi:hypothetical protein